MWTATIFRSNKNCSNYDYSFDYAKLDCVEYLKDHGVLYEINFEFDRHNDATVLKALKILGFILRSSQNFNKTDTLFYLYESLVWYILLYCEIQLTWDLWCAKHWQNI